VLPFFDGSRIFYDAILGFSVAAGIYGLAVLLLWRLPLHLILSFFGMRTLFAYVPLGSFGGQALLLIFRPLEVDSFYVTSVQVLGLYCFGVVASFVFRFFAVHIQTPSATPVAEAGK
jgi:hypothetical protein